MINFHCLYISIQSFIAPFSIGWQLDSTLYLYICKTLDPATSNATILFLFSVQTCGTKREIQKPKTNLQTSWIFTSKPSQLINHGHAALTAAVAQQRGRKNRGKAEQKDDTDSPAWPTLGSNLEAAQKYAAVKPSSWSGEMLIRLSALTAQDSSEIHSATTTTVRRV